MQTLTEFVMRVADLAEAEGRVLRSMTARLALGIGIITVAVGAVAAGVGLILGAIYIVTADCTGTAAGAAITGALSLGIGVFLAWLGRRTAN